MDNTQDNFKLPPFPKYDKLKRYTTITVPDDADIVSELSSLKDKLLSDFHFVPPIFSEYVITADLTTHYTKLVLDEMYDYALSKNYDLSSINRYIKENKDKVLSDTYKGLPLCRNNLVRWHSETEFSVLCYDLGKKVLFVNATYDFNKDGKAFLSIRSSPLNNAYSYLYERDIEQYRRECEQRVLWVLAVSKFLLEYTDKVQYEKIAYYPKNTSSNTQNTERQAQNNKIRNNSNNNIIVLNSKVKRYTISIDDIHNCKKRKYTPIKSSWFVRGYYQHFGRDKVLKYIPPRINKRNPNSLISPRPNNYIIK